MNREGPLTEGAADRIKDLRAGVMALKHVTPTDGELADACGDLRFLETELGRIRRRWESLTSEMPALEDRRAKRVDPSSRAGTPVARGERYELVPKGQNDYTYNTPAIIVGLADRMGDGFGPTDALQEAIATGAVKLTWGIKALQKLATDWGMTLTIGGEATSDDAGLDAPHVGKVWKQTGVDRVPIKGGD